MKKIITVLASVLLLCAMVFSMASCFGSVDMAELKTTIEELDKNDENITASCTETPDDKVELKTYRVTMKVGDGYEYLEITEYSTKKLAKLYADEAKMQIDMMEKSIKLQEKINEELAEVGAKVEEIDDEGEYIVKCKGTVLIVGNKGVYEKVFG